MADGLNVAPVGFGSKSVVDTWIIGLIRQTDGTARRSVFVEHASSSPHHLRFGETQFKIHDVV